MPGGGIGEAEHPVPLGAFLQPGLSPAAAHPGDELHPGRSVASPGRLRPGSWRWCAALRHARSWASRRRACRLGGSRR
jgi:hypothetical protein